MSLPCNGTSYLHNIRVESPGVPIVSPVGTAVVTATIIRDGEVLADSGPRTLTVIPFDPPIL